MSEIVKNKKRRLMNRIRDGVYSPPDVVKNLHAISCTHWQHFDGFKKCNIYMKHVNKNVCFECDCKPFTTNYCSHIVGVILKISLMQVSQVGMECNPNSIIEMFKNMDV